MRYEIYNGDRFIDSVDSFFDVALVVLTTVGLDILSLYDVKVFDRVTGRNFPATMAL